jgi:hypothetical protein
MVAISQHRRVRDNQSRGPIPGDKYPEQVAQPMDQEVSIAITHPVDSILTSSERAAFEKSSRLARSQPLPDGDDDDFADEPLPRPYDPETSTPYDWTKLARIQEKDSEGNGLNSRI